LGGSNFLELRECELRRKPIFGSSLHSKEESGPKVAILLRVPLDWPGFSRKKYWTLQEEILDSPGRNTGLSRKKYWTLQEEILDSPGNTF
jgi:hypothetical protein